MKTTTRARITRRAILATTIAPALLATGFAADVFIPPNFTINSDGGAPTYVEGLREGFLAGDFNVSDANPANSSPELGLRMATSTAFGPDLWADNRTWVYTGQIFTGANGVISVAANCDDNDWFKINGSVILNDNGWDTAVAGRITGLTPNSWVDFEYRSGNGGGGAGPSGQDGWSDTVGAVISHSDLGLSTNPNDYTYGTAGANSYGDADGIPDATMELFRYQVAPSLSDSLRITATGTITIDGTLATVTEPSMSFENAAAAALTVNDGTGSHKTLGFSGLTQWATVASGGAAVTLSGSSDVRPGQMSDNGINVTVTRGAGGGMLILDSTAAHTLGNTTFAANGGIISVVSSGTNPVPNATFAIAGAGGVLRISASADTTFNNAINVTGSGTLQRTGSSNDTLSGPLTFSAGANLTLEVEDGSLRLTGAVSGTGDTFVKTGAGDLILGNMTSTYTGKTIIQAGTLKIGNVNGSDSIRLTNAGVAGPLGAPTGANATIDLWNDVTLLLGSTEPRFNQETDRTINLAGTGAGTVAIKVNDNDTSFTFGAVTATGTGAKTLALYTGYQGNGDREEMTFNGSVSEAPGGGPLSLQVTYKPTSGSKNVVNLKAGGTFTGPITLMNDGNVDFAYLTIGGKITFAYFSGDNIYTPGSGTLNGGSYAGAISLATNTILYYNSSAAQTLSGVISGAGSVTKDVAGSTLTLTGANTYTGTTTISAGTLRVGNGGTSGSLGTGNTTNNASLVFNRSDASSYSGVISGTGSVTKEGAGTTTLTGANTYTGATTISAGTLKLQPGSAAPSTPVAGYARWFDASTIAGADGASISTWTNGGAGGDATVPGGNSAPTKVSNAGTETGLSALHFNAGGGANDSQALTFARDTNVRTVFSIFKGSSFLITDSNNYGFHRPSDGNPADPLFAGNYGGDMNNVLGGSAYINGALVNPQSFAMPTSLHNGYNLVSVLTAGDVAVNGFNKDRTYHSGDQSQAEVLIYDTLLNNTDRLAVEAYLNYKWFGITNSGGGSLPSTTPVTIASSATLDLNGVSQQIASLTGPSGGSVTNSGVTDSLLTISGASNTDFGGVISNGGTNKISLGKSGASIQTLSGANTYTGATTINAGTLKAGVASVANTSGAFGNNSAVSLSNTAGAILDITGFNTQIGSLTGGGTTGGNVTLGAATLTVGGDNTSPAAYAGLFSGTGPITKIGNGTQIFSGANNYTGATTVSAGTLSARNTLNTWKSSVAIASGATFNWNVTSNQQVADSAGNYTISGAGLLTLSGGFKLDFGNNTPVIQFNLSAGGQMDVQGTNTIVEFGYTHNSMGGNLGSLNVGAGASYRNSDASAVVDALTGSGVVGNAYNGSFALTVGVSNTVNNAAYGVSGNTATFSGVIKDVEGYNGQGSGPSSLIKAGTGTQILSGANTYTGLTTVSLGTLVATNATSLGTIAAGTTVTSGATLDVQANIGTEAITVGGSGVGANGALVASTGTGTVGGAVALTVATSIGGAGTLNVNGAVTGGFNLNKVGAGTTNFGPAGSLAGVGNLTAEAGTTNVNSVLGTGTSAVSVGPATAATLKFGSVSQTLSSLTIGAGSTVTFTSGLASFSGGGSGGKAPKFGGGTAVVPEPGTLGLLLVGALGMLNRRRRQA